MQTINHNHTRTDKQPKLPRAITGRRNNPRQALCCTKVLLVLGRTTVYKQYLILIALAFSHGAVQGGMSQLQAASGAAAICNAKLSSASTLLLSEDSSRGSNHGHAAKTCRVKRLIRSKSNEDHER
eukprot:5272748-Amphidinium_carterae.1